jgi:hypothetical protein
MKKKLKLQAEFNYDFHLFGLISKSKEYTLSWAINRALDIELEKQEDLTITLKNKTKLKVSNFSYETDSCGFFLIKNRLEEEIEGEQVIFAPSLNTFDYILKIESDNNPFINDIYAGMRGVAHIQSVLKLDVTKIKEKEYFLL